jgi:hypothetical protein
MGTSTATGAVGGWQPSASGVLSTGPRRRVCMTPGCIRGVLKFGAAKRVHRPVLPIFLPRKGWECKTETHKRKFP